MGTNEVAGQVKPWIDAEQNETRFPKRGYTEFVSVRAAWRRRGLARALVARALQAQKEAGMLESALAWTVTAHFAPLACTKTVDLPSSNAMRFIARP